MELATEAGKTFVDEFPGERMQVTCDWDSEAFGIDEPDWVNEDNYYAFWELYRDTFHAYIEKTLKKTSKKK